MAGISTLFEIGRNALQASQQSLTVIGQNVANVNTPGYSKQDAVLTETVPQDGNPGQVGTGVRVAEIRRTVDQLLDGQLNTSHQKLGRYQAYRSALFRVQSLYGDSNDQGIGAALNGFFSSLQDVATNPSDVTARSVLLSKAATLTGQMAQTASNLNEQRKSLDTQISQTITEVNGLATQIADLNAKINDATIREQNANDLKDQRGRLLNDLADRIGFSSIEDASGQVSIFVGRGQVLVEKGTTRTLSGLARSDNGGMQDVRYAVGSTSATQDITSLITGGKLKGLLDARDTIIPNQLQALDRLAAGLVTEVNQQHRQGYGLDGSTGQDFFSTLSVSSTIPSTNSGTTSVSASSISAPSLLTLHDYEIRFTAGPVYTLVDATTGTNVKGNYAGTAVTVPLTVVAATADKFKATVDGTTSGDLTLTPGTYTGAQLATEVQTRINADATLTAAGKSVTVTYDPTNSRLIVTSDSTASTSAVTFAAPGAGSDARASLGLSAGTATATSGAFVAGSTFTLDGIQVTVAGTPTAGDKLKINAYTGAAEDASVSLTSADKVAAASSLGGIPGDNTNALALSALQSKSMAGLGNVTFSGAYQAAATSIGTSAQGADRDLNAQQGLQDQLQVFRGEVSGVSMDEELINMLKYQRMFEMASRMIKMTDELLQTLVTIKQ
ncbi:MAG: flagellar hook-associated protein FlgK [Nitrospirae bacterium]|nr:MAG: flagellar hook-associated protein FlgK [Nitrospirota bacterium]